MARTRETISADNGAPKPDKRNRKRFIVYADESGKPDLSTVPDELRGAIPGAPPPATGPTASPESVEPPPEPLDPAIMQMLLPLVCALEASILGPRMGIDVHKARELITPPEPMANGIVMAATKVANKYGGTLGRYQDELALAAVLVMWQTAAFGALRQYAAQNAPPVQTPPPPPDVHHSTQPEPPPAPPVAPEPVTKSVDIGESLFTGGSDA